MIRTSYSKYIEPLLIKFNRRLNFFRLSSRRRPGSSDIPGCRIKSGMTEYTYFAGLILSGFLLAATFLPGPLNAETRPYRVAVVPFTVNAEKDLTYLKNGIADMLTSRLAWENKVQVLGREQTVAAAKQATGPLNEIQAQILGAKLQADYVLFGSLTIFGNSVSMDAKMMDVSGERQTLSFFNQAEGMGKVIPQINRFATDINAQVFGRQAAVPVSLAPSAARGTVAAPTQQQDIHAHPEKLLEDGARGEVAAASPVVPFATPDAQPQSNSLNSAFISTSGADQGTGAFWKSANFKHLISGIDLGDVNGDQILETVVATPDKIIIFQGVNNKFRKIYEHETGSFVKNLGVDIADINGNGFPEIYISGLNSQRNGINSTVLEFNGQTYQVLAKNTRWLFRVADHNIHGKILIGQKRKSEQLDPFSSAVYELSWQGAELKSHDRLLPPGKTNVLGIAYSDIQNNGSETIAAYTKTDKLQLLNRSGKEIWTSGETTGGNLQHFSMPATGKGDSGLNPFFLPTRLRSTDLDGDGKYEVILIKNFEMAGRKLQQFRNYNGGQIESHIWNGLGMVPLWKTRKISGRIQDFAIGDFDGDGRKELVVAVIMKEGRISLTKQTSAIIAYELNQ
jgi:TolB-like protein